MIPITRKENYLNEIVGWGETAPEKPLTPEEFFFAAILGEAVQTHEPLSRYQIYLAKIAGRNISVPKPLTRLELFLAKACGMDIETPTPITREEIFWSSYSAIVDFEVEGVPPLSYKALAAGELENYRIYGNTVGGESVGDRTGNLFDYTTMSGTNGVRLNSDGSEIQDPQWAITDYIPCDGLVFTINKIGGLSPAICLYDASKTFIVGKAYNTPSAQIKASVTISSNTPAKYIRFSYFISDVYPTAIDDLTKIMLNSGSAPLPYEPYGYKVPVTVSNGTDTQTIPIYLPEPIKMVGDEAEYIDYGEQKQHRIGADDVDVTLPALPTLTGANVLSVGTAVQPSKVYVKYKGERQ